MNLLLGIIIVFINFLHGVFSSGFIPILNKALGEESTLAFAIYFFGLLLGQIFIYLFPKLNRASLYPICEIFFGASLIFMAIFDNEWGFTVGRFLEGLSLGLALPLLFASLINLPVFNTIGRRIVIFNSAFAIGFVAGPLLIGVLLRLMHHQFILGSFGVAFVIIPISLIFMSMPPLMEDKSKDLSLKKIFTQTNWFDKFYTLFLAKCFYGFLLSSAASYLMNYVTPYHPELSLEGVMLIFSGVFIVGQIMAERILSFYPKQHIEVYLPLVMAILLCSFYFTHNPYLILFAALCHSFLAFVGYLNFGLKASSAREFALFNSISDPAMIIGSLLAGYQLSGVWGIIAFMPVAYFYYLFKPARTVRAEANFPFNGFITMSKIVRKHKNPFYNQEVQESVKDLRFEAYTDESRQSETLKLLFTGDCCPDLSQTFEFSQEMQDLIRHHDLRCVNMEVSAIFENNETPKASFIHVLRQQQLNVLANVENPIFNMMSCVNNHVLDMGTPSYRAMIDELNMRGSSITSELNIQEINGFKIGYFGLTFGHNFVWRTMENLKSIKPENIVNKDSTRLKMRRMIRHYKEKVDLLILSYHWGYEAEYYPDEIHQNCFEILQEAGVDIVYGHHAHIVQPYQLKDNGLCLYSCGNLISNMPDMDVYKQGVLYSVEIGIEDPKNWKIQQVTPHFFEPQGTVINLIESEKVDVLKRWAEANERQS